MSTITQLATGLGGAIGSDLRRMQNQLIFTEYSGKLSRLNLFRTSTIISSGSIVLQGTWLFDFDNGVESGASPGADVWWDQQTAVARQLVPQNAAKLLNLGSVNFSALTADSLQKLTYATAPIVGNNDPSNKLVVGDVFAVQTTAGNYAKVQVLSYGYNLNIQWVTYHLDPAYAILGTGYTTPEDVKVSADNVHVYVTERTGNLLRVPLATPNRASATVVSAGMTAPHQIFLDEPHNAAYVVEYASPGHLWKIDLTTGTRIPVVSDLENAVGLILSADLQYAYVSEQTAGADKGRVSRITMSNGARLKLATGLTNPFMLTWADAGQTSLLMPERDPANTLLSINASAGGVTTVATGLAFRPSSVAVVTPGDVLICCDTIIEELVYLALMTGAPLLMGIGFIPFDKIGPAVSAPVGLANTTGDPTYPYQVKNTPFGGTLPIMVNFQRANDDLGVYYRIKVDGIARSEPYTDEKWNGAHYTAVTTQSLLVGGLPSYPVHPMSELFLWMNPSLGGFVDSTTLSNGTHQIILELLNAAGGVLETSVSVLPPVPPPAPLTIMVNNQSCVATIAQPTLLGNTADVNCGLLKYAVATKNTDVVTMAFTASHPTNDPNYATYSFAMIKGVNTLTPPTTSGTVSAVTSHVITDTVAHLLGSCAIAGYAEYVYVASSANNGWGRQGQYDASAAIAFVLAPQ